MSYEQLWEMQREYEKRILDYSIKNQLRYKDSIGKFLHFRPEKFRKKAKKCVVCLISEEGLKISKITKNKTDLNVLIFTILLNVIAGPQLVKLFCNTFIIIYFSQIC